ncbi:MAG: division/cell wall cluster transcriptional repressor MraZ [Thermoanaerobaculia bacterium]|nr:division/cell wall cluster transcriptional repressor MraZ [Thermoanaerobaculia bacterium]
MFRGSSQAKIDDKGRLKIPSHFLRRLEEGYGTELFITSVQGDRALLYPLPVWEEIESRLLEMPSTDRIRDRYLERVNYFGQQVDLDSQGRTTLPQILREAADIQGEVVVAGRLDHLVVWNHE